MRLLLCLHQHITTRWIRRIEHGIKRFHFRYFAHSSNRYSPHCSAVNMPPRAKRNAGKSQNQLFNEKADRDAAAQRALAHSKAVTTEDIVSSPPKRPTLPNRASSQLQPYPLTVNPLTAPTRNDSPPAGSLDPSLEDSLGQFGESQSLLGDEDYGVGGPASQDPANYALGDGDDDDEDEENDEDIGGEIASTQAEYQDGGGSQKKQKSPPFPWDSGRVLEFKLLEAHVKVLARNKHRAGGLRKPERDYLVGVVLKAAKELYPDEAQTLTLHWGQCKTKEDQYQRRTQAAERLLFECSGFGINWLTGLVTADDHVWEKYLKLDCHKHARPLRFEPLPGAKWCQVIWATKTATGYLSVGGASAAIASGQGKKRKRTIQPGTALDEPTAITEDAVPPVEEEEEEEDDGPVTPAVYGANTRRAGAVPPLLTPREKKVSGAELLGKSMERAAAIAAEARLAPKRQLTEARTLMFAFFGTQLHSNACMRTWNEQPWMVAPFVEGNHEYRLRFMATVQSDNNTDDNFDREVARVDFLRTRRQKQLARIAKAEAAGRKHYTVVTRRDIIEGIDLDAVRPHKIRLAESDNEDTDEEAARRSAAVPEVLKLMN